MANYICQNKIDRALGRSLRDLIGLLDDLKARGVAFRSLTEAIDTTITVGDLYGDCIIRLSGSEATI